MRKNGLKSLSFAVIFLCPALLLAADHGAADHGAVEHGAHVASMSDLFYPFINFSLFLALMIFLVKAPLLKALKARREGIASYVRSAGEKKAAAARELRSTEEKVSGLKAEVIALEQRAAEEARREAEGIRESARKKAERVLSQAKDGAISERKVLEETLRRELAEIVIQRASSRLSKEANDSSDKPLRERALDGLRSLK